MRKATFIAYLLLLFAVQLVAAVYCLQIVAISGWWFSVPFFLLVSVFYLYLFRVSITGIIFFLRKGC